jgi:methionyl-tRNA formyltransferase
VPIQHVATSEFKLLTHAVDTFTGWTPPVPFNLVVAVSFGLLVPPRILGLAKYGGLNVHPSLLPDLRGPAPIEHAILQRREHTGVSIQTLHPRHFDQGTVLAQTPAPGIPIPPMATAAELETQLAAQGAKMLLDVLKRGKHIPPHQDVGWYHGSVSHATKTTKQDRHVAFADKTFDEMNAIQQALGFPWCMLSNGERLLLSSFEQSRLEDVGMNETIEAGLYIRRGLKTPVFLTKDGEVGVVQRSTYSGAGADKGNERIMKMLTAKERVANGDQGGTREEWVRVDKH